MVVKNIIPSLNFIKSIEATNYYTIQAKEPILDGKKAETYKEGEDFYISLILNEVLGQEKRNELFRSEVNFTVINEKFNIVFDFKSFNKITQNLNINPSCYQCKVRKYFNNEITSNIPKYFRLVIPLENEQKMRGIMESDQYQTDEVLHGGGLIAIKIFSFNYHLYPYSKSDPKKYYLIYAVPQKLDNNLRWKNLKL